MSADLQMELLIASAAVLGGAVGLILGYLIGMRRGKQDALDECTWFLTCIRRSFSVICVRGLIEGTMKRPRLNQVWQEDRRKAQQKAITEKMRQ